MTTTRTKNFGFEKPDFKSPNWAGSLQRNFDGIDEALLSILGDVIPWANLTEFKIGRLVIDTIAIPAAYWICNVTHTTAAGPATFAQERVVNPTYWSPFSFGIKARGAWAHDTTYAVNDVSYDSTLGITGICKTAHVSNHAGTILDDSVNWDFIVNLPTVFAAASTSYVPHGVIVSTNVQAALNDVIDLVALSFVATNITYNNAATGLVATNVQAAVTELKVLHDTDAALIAANTTAINTGLITTGFMAWSPVAVTPVGWTICNALTIGDAASLATQRANADTAAQFAYLWNNFSNTECPVSGGRGVNPAADFAAHKTIATLDMKGTFGGLGIDTMAGGATTRLNGVPVVSGSGTTVSSVLGENLHALIAAENGPHLHAVFLNDPGHFHQLIGLYTGTAINNFNFAGAGAQGSTLSQGGATDTKTTGMTVRDTTGGGGTANQTASQGSGTAHNTVPRSKTGYWVMKL